MGWVLIVWLVTADYTLEEVDKKHFSTEKACLGAATRINIPDDKNWIASCSPL